MVGNVDTCFLYLIDYNNRLYQRYFQKRKAERNNGQRQVKVSVENKTVFSVYFPSFLGYNDL